MWLVTLLINKLVELIVNKASVKSIAFFLDVAHLMSVSNKNVKNKGVL